MSVNIDFTEGPAANPIDATQTVAIIGYLSGQLPSSNPQAPNVVAIDSPPLSSTLGPNGSALGYGAPLELAHLISRRGKRRCLIVPCNATTNGTLSAVTQTGQGATCTVAAIDGAGPRDDCALQWIIPDAGAPGTATVSFSWSYSCANGVASRLFQGKQVIPSRAQAQIIGTIDLTTVTYAKPAIVTGTVDLTTLTYGPGGTVDTETLILTLEGVGPTTVTFAAPASPAALVGQINTATSSTMASLNQQNHLVLTGTVLGTASAIINGAGTANTNLGLTGTHTTNGTAGTLDGLTALFNDDTTSSQTVTFSSPKPGSPADVVTKINGGAGIVADVFGSKNTLRLRSTTLGSASSLQITGGTGLAALGLSISVAPAVGAESTIDIPHLGVRVTFSPNTSGNFVVGTLYAATAVAPKPSDAEITARIADLDASGYPWGVVVIAHTTDLVTTLARASTLDAAMVAEHRLDHMRRSRLATDPAELDANTRSTFASFRSSWVSRSDRGAYILTSNNIPGSGFALRSQMWMACVADAFIPLYKDIGDHGINYDAGIVGLPDVGAIAIDEQTAGTKLVGLVGAGGTSSNVMIQDTDGGFYFAGGYTSADGTSRYCDQSVTNVFLRVGEITASVLSKFENATDLDTNDDETITDESAAVVDGAIEKAIESELIPSALQSVVSQVDQTIKFYSLKKLSAKVSGKNRVPARSVSGTVGPGLIATNA